METRLDTFNGWQMTVAVEIRPATGGKSRFYIVEPVACREFSKDEPLHPEKSHLFTAPFDSADDAFHAAFGVCRRAIMHSIQIRGVEGLPSNSIA